MQKSWVRGCPVLVQRLWLEICNFLVTSLTLFAVLYSRLVLTVIVFYSWKKSVENIQNELFMTEISRISTYVQRPWFLLHIFIWYSRRLRVDVIPKIWTGSALMILIYEHSVYTRPHFLSIFMHSKRGHNVFSAHRVCCGRAVLQQQQQQRRRPLKAAQMDHKLLKESLSYERKERERKKENVRSLHFGDTHVFYVYEEDIRNEWSFWGHWSTKTK